jgi:hypothetical protein
MRGLAIVRQLSPETSAPFPNRVPSWLTVIRPELEILLSISPAAHGQCTLLEVKHYNFGIRSESQRRSPSSRSA